MLVESDEFLNGFTVTCGVCASNINYKLSIKCLECKNADWDSKFNVDHSHSKWCDKMLLFMTFESFLTNLPFSFARKTTSFYFKNDDLKIFLTGVGVWGKGLWKYEFVGNENNQPWDLAVLPGSELYLFKSLWYTTLLDVDEFPPLNWSPRDEIKCTYEDAMTNAYVLPLYAILMSYSPCLTENCTTLNRNSLFVVDLYEWSDYYSWRNLDLFDKNGFETSESSNLLALLLHWPLTLYYIVAHKLPLIDQRIVENVLKNRIIIIHVIGVEKEVSLLHVFKELDNLFQPDIRINLYFVGNHVDYSVNKTIFHLSPRLIVTVWKGLYHEFVNARLMTGEKPDLIIGFNVGLAAYGTWPQSLSVISQMNVPVFFTDSCLYSAIWGFKVVGSMGFGPGESETTVLDLDTGIGDVAPIINPFRSPIRIEAPGVCWGWFSNAFIFSPFYSKQKQGMICDLSRDLSLMQMYE